MTEDVSVNPIYDIGDMPMDSLQPPGDQPTSLTMKSLTNPNYECTLDVGVQRERVASNPIYETGGGVPDRGSSHADMNPLYESGPVVSTSGKSGSVADSNPLYQSATSYRSQSDFNPLYEGTSDVSRLFDSATTTEEPKGGSLRRRVDSRSKREGKEGREDELPIIDAECTGNDDSDGLGISNMGADVTFNELYGNVEQPHSSPHESEPDVPPIPPRQHAKRS